MLTRLPRLKLVHSGLAIIGVILVCELIYLLFFSWELDHADTRVEQALASYAGIVNVSDSTKLLYGANASLLAYAMTDRTKIFAESYYDTMRELNKPTLIETDTAPGATSHASTPVMENSKALKRSVIEGLEKSMKTVQESRDRIEFTRILSVRQLEMVQKNTYQLIERYVSEIAQDLASDAETLQKNLQRESEVEARLRTNIIVGFALNVLLSLFLVVFWVTRVVRRVDRLQKNADKLGRSEPLLAMRGGADELAELELVLQDVHLRRRQNAELRAEFVTFLSEDLSSTLKRIESTLALGEAGEMGLDGKGRQGFARSLSSARRLERLIEELIYVYEVDSEAQDEAWQEANIAELLKSAVEEVASLAASSSVEIALESEDCQIRCQADKIQQVVINLLSNAIKYSSAGMTVFVRMKREPSRIILQIEDQGPGIPPEFQDKLFERYEQAHTARKGTGLGLFICQKVISQHGGEIGAENLPDAGARFWFSLPTCHITTDES